MVEKMADGSLKIVGRVDTNNAGQFEQELMALCQPGTEVTIDAEGLDYISSSGLRVFMRLKKKIRSEVHVINVNKEIYDIFDMTGFVQILDVRKQMRTLSIEGCDCIGEGANGKVYRIGSDIIVKVFKSGASMEEVLQERNVAQAAFLAGVPTAISYDVAKVGDSYGAVYEMLNASTLSSVIRENPERADEFGTRMGKLLRELHETPADKNRLQNMLDVYKDRVERMNKYLEPKELDKLRSVYNVLEDRDTMIHGDYHPKNIMLMDDELIFIDMGDVGYGHPLLDLGGTYLTLVRTGSKNPESALKYVGIDFESCMRVWNSMTLEYFGGQNVEEGRKLAEIYAEAKYSTLPAAFSGFSEAACQGMVAKGRINGFLSDSYDISAALNTTLKI